MTKKFFLKILLITFLFPSCSFLEKKSTINSLHELHFDLNKLKKNYKGMTKEQIIYIFGNPIISDSFSDVYHYVFCEKESKNNGCYQRTLSVFFKDNTVLKLNIE
ncbi:outer membrane protein assembly factor BamE [Buchnera aphidicola]|uniref:outer membrane protein assembly factor BamE n=1 Tax=Buchnera aphidicola TaxID=9 RepID=UPI003463A9EF